MDSILDFEDGRVIIKPEAIAISYFKKLWDNDKTKTKDKANDDITFIWFTTNFKSPYFDYDLDERFDLVKQQILKDPSYKPSKDVLEARDMYEKGFNTPSIKLVESANTVIFKLDNYFKAIDFSAIDNNGKLMYDAKDVIDTITRIPKAIEAINLAKELCRKETTTKSSRKGSATNSMFEE